MNIETLLETTRQAMDRERNGTTTKHYESINEVISKAQEELKTIDDYFWRTGEGYKAPHFPNFCENLENLESGFYIFAGESNSGKTAVMSNIFWDFVLNTENHLYGVYFSLDDSKKEIYPRIIAMQENIPISCVKKPKIYEDQLHSDSVRYAHHVDYLAKRARGYENLIEQCQHVIILDTSSTEDGASNDVDIFNTIKNIQALIKKQDPEANIIVSIDAIDDIRLKNEVSDKDEEIAKIVKSWAVQLDIPIFVTKHLKKLNANRRPILDDLRQSNTLVYEASAVFIIYNDVSKNKQQSKVFYLDDDGETKRPIIEMDWAKNKKSSYKSLDFYHLVPEYSKVYECSRDLCKHYERSVYSI